MSQATTTLTRPESPALDVEVLLDVVAAPVVIMSACWSGMYEIGPGEMPAGLGPELLARGAGAVIVMRNEVGAAFASALSSAVGAKMAVGLNAEVALAEALGDVEGRFDRWRDLASVEILRGVELPRSSDAARTQAGA